MNFSDLPPLKPAGGRALLPLEPWWVPPKTGCRNGEDVYVIGSFFDEPRAALVLIVTSDRIRDEHVAGMELPSAFVRQGEQGGLELDLLGLDEGGAR